MNLCSSDDKVTVANKGVRGDEMGMINMPIYLCSSQGGGQGHQSFWIKFSYHIDTDTKYYMY